MKIVQLMSHLDVGGITRYVLTIAPRLNARGHEVIIASDGGFCEEQVAAQGLRRWHVPLHTSAEISPRVFRAYHQLLRHLHDEPVDVIHAHTRVAQVVADRLSAQLGIPYVTTWHGVFRRRLGRRLWPCTGTRTIAISEMVRQHLLRDFHVPTTAARLIYNGIETEAYAVPPDVATVRAYRQRWEIPVGAPVIGGMGRMASGRVKGFDSLLVAASLLKDQVADLHVLLVGDGPRRPFLEEVAKRLRVEDCVRFVGAVQDVRVPLAAMDVFIFPSRWPEGFGLTLIEAMATGKPVVATRNGAVEEIVRHEVDGLLVPAEDPLVLAQSVARLLTDRSFASQLGRAAQARVRETFSLDRMVTQIEAVYHDAIAVNQHAPAGMERQSQ